MFWLLIYLFQIIPVLGVALKNIYSYIFSNSFVIFETSEFKDFESPIFGLPLTKDINNRIQQIMDFLGQDIRKCELLVLKRSFESSLQAKCYKKKCTKSL